MGDFFRGVIGAIGGVTAMALGLAVGIFYLFAFLTGADIWFGWDGWWVAVIAVLAMMVLGPIGTVFIAIVGGYGAMYGWHWHWLPTIVVFFPGIAFMVGGILLTTVTSIFAGNR